MRWGYAGAVCVWDLALNVPSVVGNALVCTDLDIKESPGHGGWVQGVHLPPDVSLKLIKIGGPRAVDTGLQKPPQVEVQRIEVKAPGRPVSTSTTPP